jgi:hypothetical protein
VTPSDFYVMRAGVTKPGYKQKRQLICSSFIFDDITKEDAAQPDFDASKSEFHDQAEAEADTGL